MDDLRQLNERFLEAKAFKDRWLANYQQLYTYVIPNRDAMNVKFNYQDDGKPTTEQVWDDTAVIAAYQRANDLHGLLLPKDRIWGKLSLDPHFYDERIVKSEEAQRLMDEMNERIFFYINESNLARVVSSSNLDLVGGTAAIWVESVDDFTPLYFRSIPAVALYIEYSTDDVLNNCWYSCKMRGRQILESFPKYKGKMRRSFIENPNEVYIVNYGQIKIKEDHFYIYAVLEDDPLTALFEVERNYNQIIIYRDRVRPGEAEGRGVGLDLLSTIKDLNYIVQCNRKSLAWKANPPIFYDADSYFSPNSLRQISGAMIARNPQGRNPLEAMQTPVSPEVLNHIQHLQEVIRVGFQVDPLGEINTPVRSATEISIRENRAQRTSATDISRLINELPKQIFEVSAKILNERSLLVKKREQIPGFTTRKLRFDYKSPLYDLQNQEDLNHFVTNMQIKQQFAGQGATLASVNLIEMQHFLTEKLNLPKKLFSNDEEIQNYLSAMLEQQQAQAQLPQPRASASPVSLPQAPGVTI